MIHLMTDDIVKATEGEISGNKNNTEISGISTDTRTIEKGQLFVAIRGDNFDGHKFLNMAHEKGAAAIITEEDFKADCAVIKVKDSRKALGDIAKYYIGLFSIPVVAITGSVGKTTTKDMISSVLSEKYNVLKTDGNFNNDIGVPLTIFRLEERHTAAVIEMGMNHFGEISKLTRIAKPDIAVITNVGVSHIENLGSREGILKAKCEIFEGLKENGTKILNGDDDMLITVKDEKTLYFGIDNKDAEIYADSIEEKGLDGIKCRIHIRDKEMDVNIPLPGKHMIYNSLAAASVGDKLGLTTEEIKRGIEKFRPSKMRMDIIKNKDITIINDVYNANPNSMKAGIDVVAGCDGGKCCIMGDMLELGEKSADMHREVGEYAAKKGIDRIICIGEISKNMYEGAKEAKNEDQQIFYFEKKEDFLDKYKDIVRKGDTVLIKASRGMRFEKITEKINES